MGFLQKMFKNAYNFPTRLTTWDMPTYSNAGELITTETALYLAPVYAAINAKASTLSKMPLEVFQKTDKGNIKANNQISYLLNTRPNPNMTPFQFIHLIITHQNAYGVSYVKMDFDNKGNIKALIPLNSPYVSLAIDDNGNKFYIESGYDIINQDLLTPQVYNEDEIIRLPYLTMDGFTAKSPIAVLRETIGTYKKQQKFLGSYYSNGTLARGVLKIPTQLNKSAKDKVREAWMEANAGEDNMSKIAILDNGIDFQNITLPLEDAEFIASQKFGVEEIARVFGVPLHLLQSLDHATYSNIEQQSIDFISNTIHPMAVLMEQEMSFKLFTKNQQQAGFHVKFDLSSGLRADSVSRANYYKTLLDSGVLSINEVRAKEEMNAIANGDKHFVSLNFASLDTIDEYQAAKNGEGGS